MWELDTEGGGNYVGSFEALIQLKTLCEAMGYRCHMREIVKDEEAPF